jgi:diguanylate cyclase (GGDEF)-like protein/PAS domain S-box-containing protein
MKRPERTGAPLDPAAWLRAVTANAPVVIWAVDLDGKIMLSEGKGLEGAGLKPGELVGQSFYERYGDYPGMISAHQRALEGESFTTVLPGAGGTMFESHYEPIREGEKVVGVFGVGVDVTARAAAQGRLRYLASHDDLTGLPNRSLFEQHLEAAISRTARHGGHLAILYLDLDWVKAVNESLGHEAGDDLLRQVARRLEQTLRDEDIVARHSGDEFLVLLNLAKPDGSRVGEGEAIQMSTQTAARIHEALAVPFRLAGSEVAVGASIGISLFPTDAEEPESLIRHADDAMSQSKGMGKGGSALYMEVADESVAQFSRTRLGRAIELDELELHYQPIVSLDSGTCERVEALLRWRHAERGLIPPLDFIPMAEESNLIESIGEWVAAEACRQLASWQALGLSLGVSINLSLRELRRPDLVQRISRAVEGAGLPAGSLTVEITESAAMTEIGRLREVVDGLLGRGIGLAIDDFGAGYSSLGRLRELRGVETLKVDRSFVRDVPGDDFATRLVAGIVDISRGLDMTPLAEGIETEEQLQFLVDIGCPLGQGFHLGRPLEAHMVEHWLSSEARR